MASSEISEKYAELVAQVRAASDINAVVGEDAKLVEKHGRGFKCCSPLRPDRSPSFWTYTDTQSWTDWGTGEGGDVFTYVQKRDNIGFHDALLVLARRASITPYWMSDASDPYDAEARGYLKRRVVLEMLAEGIAYYHAALPTRIRALIRKQWGLTDDTIDKLQIGWATWSPALAHHFVDELGYKPEACLKTGLFLDRRDGSIIDFFSARIIFPYWAGGQVVYAIGRRVDGITEDEDYERAKYKKLLVHNDKHPYVDSCISNEWFWGEDAVRARVSRLVISEGVTDAAAAWQAGIPTFSPVTTRFRKEDIPKLVRLTERVDQVIICNDADVAADGSRPGERGALSTAAALYASGRDVRIAVLPKPSDVPKIDLNEFLRDNDAEVLQKVVLDKAKRYPEFLVEQIPTTLDPADLEDRLKPVAEMIAGMSTLQKESSIKKVAKRFQVAKRTIESMVSQFAPIAPTASDEEQKAAEVRKEKAESEDRVKGRVYEELTYYYTRSRDGVEERISSFVLQPKQRIRHDDGGELLECDVRTMRGRKMPSFIFPKSAWSSRRDFIRCFSSPDMQWSGSDDQVQGVLRLVADCEVPERRGTSNLGYHDSDNGPRWIWPNHAISPEGDMEAPDVVYQNNGASLGGRLAYSCGELADVRELAAEVIPALLSVNHPSVLLPVLGWFYATPFKPRIARALGHFPILLIWGTQGSGKSSIVREVFWPLFGIARERTEPYSCTETEFALMKLLSVTNSIPVFLDEFKPRDMGKIRVDRLMRLLRRVYGGEIEERGRMDQTLASYHLQAPIVIAGESPFEGDPAITERTISVSPDKNYIDVSEDARVCFRKLSHMSLPRLAGPFIRWSLDRDVEKDLGTARAITENLLSQAMPGGRLPPRVFDNLLTMVFGVQAFELWASDLGVSVPDVDMLGAFEAMTKSILEGEGAQVKDSFDCWLESLSTYAHLGVLEEGKHYVLENGKLGLHVGSCHDTYLQERRKTGREDDTNGPKALRRIAFEKLARGSSYIEEVDARMAMENGHIRAIKIDMSKVPEHLDFERFPAKRGDRPWREREGTDSWENRGWQSRGGDA